jgi:hypothetical protein
MKTPDFPKITAGLLATCIITTITFAALDLREAALAASIGAVYTTGWLNGRHHTIKALGNFLEFTRKTQRDLTRLRQLLKEPPEN